MRIDDKSIAEIHAIEDAREKEALAVIGKTVGAVLDGAGDWSRERLTIEFTDGSKLVLTACSCCEGIGVAS